MFVDAHEDRAGHDEDADDLPENGGQQGSRAQFGLLGQDADDRAAAGGGQRREAPDVAAKTRPRSSLGMRGWHTPRQEMVPLPQSR